MANGRPKAGKVKINSHQNYDVKMSWQQKLPGKWPKKVYFQVENLPCPFGPEPNFKLHIHHSAYGPWAQSTQYKRLYSVKIRNQNDMIITISTEKVFMFISFLLLLLLLLVGVFISFSRCCTQNNKQLFANEYKNMSLIFYVKCTRWEKKELDGKIVVKDFCFIFEGDPLFWMSTFRKIKKKRKRNCLRFNISCPSASSNEFFCDILQHDEHASSLFLSWAEQKVSVMPRRENKTNHGTGKCRGSTKKTPEKLGSVCITTSNDISRIQSNCLFNVANVRTWNNVKGAITTETVI